MGTGVRAGTSEAPANTVDMAPTLARLAGIPTPDDLDGTVVYR
jgi:arylsulfatase A-like enzyme